ncbi:MAG: Gfo/Idh/MocA family protein [Lacipirellulaceae bacterium]
MKLRVGLVGLGPTWITRHRPALSALASRFEVRAVCDPVAHRADQVAAELRARSIDGFRALATADDVDAVLLLSGRWFGALPILAACDAGKAVYCGASVEMRADEATELQARVRQSGVAFMAELPHRLAPATIRLKELIATRLGPPRLLFCNERLGAPKSAGEGATSHTRRLIEMVDWCRYVVGREATAVTGTRHEALATDASGALVKRSCSSGGREDYTLVTLEFGQATPGIKRPAGLEDPCPFAQIACGGYVQQAWTEAASFRRPADLQVVCENGVAFVDLPSQLVWFDGAGQHTESLEHERPLGEQLLMEFHRSVSSLVLRSSSLEDAFRALTIVLAARKSAATGLKVDCTPG